MEREDKAGTEPQHRTSAGRDMAKSLGWGCVWLSNGHRRFPADHTNLGGQVLGGVPPSHPWLQEGCTLTEGLSAEEERRAELEMTDRKGYGLHCVDVPRENKGEGRL